MKLSTCLPLAICGLALNATAQLTPSSEGEYLPKHLTAAERAYIAANPIGVLKAVTPPPTGPVHCTAEYEPMDAILMSYEGGGSWKTILHKMAKEITTTGNADVWMIVDTAGEQSTAAAALAAAGADMSRVRFEVIATDSIWSRDYGAMYIYQGDVRAMVDHEYNRPRPLDNAMSSKLGPKVGHRVYELPLVHGGGNYHLSALGDSYQSELIVNENPGFTPQEIIDTWQDYLNVVTTLATPFPTFVDSTQHIDMWMQITGDTTVLISDWPFDAGSIQDKICDGATAALQSKGYTVTRIPARSISGTHYTYTNLVMCNDLVLLPEYTHGSMLVHNTEAFNAVAASLPKLTVVPIDCQAIVGASGVMHCICKHVPVPKGGPIPTAYVISLNGGESVPAGSQFAVEYGTDDDEAVVSATLEYSADNGGNWTVLASGLPAYGSYLWSVPGSTTTQALLRVTAFDAAGNSGADVTDGVFVVGGGGTAGQNIPYGTGKPGAAGLPVLSSSTPPNIGQPWTADLTNALAASPAWLIFGHATASLPFDGGTQLVAYTKVYPIPTNGLGVGSWSTTVPAVPSLVGISVYWQVGIPNDPGASGLGWAMTNGLETLVGQ